MKKRNHLLLTLLFCIAPIPTGAFIEPDPVGVGLATEGDLAVGVWGDLIVEVYSDIEGRMERLRLALPNHVQTDLSSLEAQRQPLDGATDLVLLPAVDLTPNAPVGFRVPVRIDRAELTEIRLLSEYGSSTRRFDLRPDLPCPDGQRFLRAWRECIPVGHDCRKLTDCGRVCWPEGEEKGYENAFLRACEPQLFAALEAQRERQELRETVTLLPNAQPHTPQRAKWMVIRLDQNRRAAQLEESGTYLLSAIENHAQELDQVLNANPELYASFIEIVDRFGQIAPRIANGEMRRGDLPELKDLQHESDRWLHDLYKISSKALELEFKKARNLEKQVIMLSL